MIKHEPRAHVEMPPDRKYSPQGEPRTVFISKIPKKGITDDVLYADFSGFGRVLATKVFIPKTLIQGTPKRTPSAEMVYGPEKEMRAEGFGSVAPQDFRKAIRSQESESSGFMAIGDTEKVDVRGVLGD